MGQSKEQEGRVWQKKKGLGQAKCLALVTMELTSQRQNFLVKGLKPFNREKNTLPETHIYLNININNCNSFLQFLLRRTYIKYLRLFRGKWLETNHVLTI